MSRSQSLKSLRPARLQIRRVLLVGIRRKLVFGSALACTSTDKGQAARFFPSSVSCSVTFGCAQSALRGGLGMIGSLLVTSAFAVLQVAGPPQRKDKPETTAKAAVAIDPGAAIAEYNALKEKTPSTAAAQWKLGLWCEGQGLKDLAYVHFAEVVQLDPRRDAACASSVSRGIIAAGRPMSRLPRSMSKRRLTRSGDQS